jgi:hypothetical protein
MIFAAAVVNLVSRQPPQNARERHGWQITVMND